MRYCYHDDVLYENDCAHAKCSKKSSRNGISEKTRERLSKAKIRLSIIVSNANKKRT